MKYLRGVLIGGSIALSLSLLLIIESFILWEVTPTKDGIIAMIAWIIIGAIIGMFYEKFTKTPYQTKHKRRN